MITLKQEEKLLDRIKSLTELELTTLIQELRDHIIKNDLGHIFNAISDVEDLRDEIDDLNDKIEKLESENSKLESKLDEINSISNI